jgi:putative Holliday junction resolvase
MSETTGPSGPALGLDLGDARIGVALTDPGRRLALPLGTVKVGSPPGEIVAIADLVREHGVTTIVVGLPVTMSGTRGTRALKAEAFADALRDAIGVQVELQDERLTSVEADRALGSADVPARARRSVVDRTAATIILQAWIDARRG